VSQHKADRACECVVVTVRIQLFPRRVDELFINCMKLKLMEKKIGLESITQHPYNNNCNINKSSFWKKKIRPSEWYEILFSVA